MGWKRPARMYNRRPNGQFCCCVPGHTQNAHERTRSMQKAWQGAEMPRSATKGREGCKGTHRGSRGVAAVGLSGMAHLASCANALLCLCVHEKSG